MIRLNVSLRADLTDSSTQWIRDLNCWNWGVLCSAVPTNAMAAGELRAEPVGAEALLERGGTAGVTGFA
jgi:hypothetical protein